MLKQFIEYSTPKLLYTRPVKAYLEDRSKNMYRIVYYHFVGDKIPSYYFKKKGITRTEFKQQLIYFKQKFNVITVKEAIEMSSQGASLAGCLTVTTDDGFRENYDVIAPMMDEKNLSASFFISTDFIDNKDLMWRNKLVYLINEFPLNDVLHEADLLPARHMEKVQNLRNVKDLMAWTLKDWDTRKKDIYSSQLWDKFMPKINEFLNENKPYLTTQQIKELHSSGFDICSHSCSHPDLSNASWDDYKHEVLSSIQRLREITNQRRVSFSYPFGRRAPDDFESKLIEKYSEDVSSLMGIYNVNRNGRNPYKWERDLQEDTINMSRFRFLLLPIIRKYI